MCVFLTAFFYKQLKLFLYGARKNQDFIQSLVAFWISNICYSGGWVYRTSRLFQHGHCKLLLPCIYRTKTNMHRIKVDAKKGIPNRKKLFEAQETKKKIWRCNLPPCGKAKWLEGQTPPFNFIGLFPLGTLTRKSKEYTTRLFGDSFQKCLCDYCKLELLCSVLLVVLLWRCQ